MCIKVSLHKISLIALAASLSLGVINAEEVNANNNNEVLFKKALIKLFKQNQALEQRIVVLEDKLKIKRPEQNASISEPKPLSENTFVFLERAKAQFKKGAKMVFGQAIKDINVYEKPDISSKIVLKIKKGQKVYAKGIVEQYGNTWYKYEDDMYISADSVSFRSKK